MRLIHRPFLGGGGDHLRNVIEVDGTVRAELRLEPLQHPMRVHVEQDGLRHPRCPTRECHHVLRFNEPGHQLPHVWHGRRTGNQYPVEITGLELHVARTLLLDVASAQPLTLTLLRSEERHHSVNRGFLVRIVVVEELVDHLWVLYSLQVGGVLDLLTYLALQSLLRLPGNVVRSVQVVFRPLPRVLHLLQLTLKGAALEHEHDLDTGDATSVVDSGQHRHRAEAGEGMPTHDAVSDNLRERLDGRGVEEPLPTPLIQRLRDGRHMADPDITLSTNGLPRIQPVAYCPISVTGVTVRVRHR